MQLSYNGFRLDALGKLEISQERTYEGGTDSPQRARVTFKVKIHLTQTSFVDNYGLALQAIAALAAQQGTLLWVDETAAQTWLNQSVTVNSHTLTKEMGQLDTFYMPVEISFHYFEQALVTNNLAVKFTPSGGSEMALGNYTELRESYHAARFDAMRSQRSRTGGTVHLKGLFLVDATLPLATRRGLLFTLLKQWKDGVNQKDGALVFGALANGNPYFNQTVRVEEFDGVIDGAVNSIAWELTGIYTRFPDEGGYATAEYKTSRRTDVETGDELLSFSGRIMSTDLVTALGQLDTLRGAAVTAPGIDFTLQQRIKTEQTPSSVSANADGVTFIELTFAEEYRRRMATVLSFTLKTASTVDARTAMTTTTFSGRVVAGGASATAAYNAASGKAVELGGNAGNCMLSSRLSWDQRQEDPAGLLEFVALEFEYSYLGKATDVFIEVSSARVTEASGLDAIQVSGYVAAPDEGAARTQYASQVRTAYNGSLVRHEEVKVQTESWQQGGGSFTTLMIRLDFNFTVFAAKGAGVSAVQYEIGTSFDYLELDKVMTVGGTAYGATAGSCRTAVAALLTALGYTNQTHYEDKEGHELLAGSPSAGDYFMKLDFSARYQDRITGDSACLSTEISEEVTYSGPRWKPQEVPDGVSVVQNCGIVPGARTIRATVKAATEAIADAAAKVHAALLTGDADGGHYPQPAQRSVKFSFVPRITGVARDGEPVGGGPALANARVAEVAYTFAEILPNYPQPGV